MARYRNSYNGAERTSAELIGYPWIEIADEAGGEPIETQTEFAKPTADAIILEVGTDADKAQAALDEENASESPRTSLIAKLERIVRNAES